MNELQLLPPNEIINMGNVFWQSGMFKDVTSAAQVIVKIQAGQEIGIPPYQAVTGIHMIQGKPEIGAHILAAKIKASGKYDFKVTKHTDQVCEIDFYEGKKLLGSTSFSIEDAKRAGTKNMDKFPRNMLFARAISNGYRFHCPDVFSAPVYVFGEINGDAAESEDTAATVTTASVGAPSQSAQPMAPVAPAPAPAAKPALPELTKDDPSWPKIIEWLKSGGTIDNLKVRYTLSGQIVDQLRADSYVSPAPSFPPGPVTQQDIHQANAGYQKPTEAIKQAEAKPEPFDPNRPF